MSLESEFPFRAICNMLYIYYSREVYIYDQRRIYGGCTTDELFA